MSGDQLAEWFAFVANHLDEFPSSGLIFQKAGRGFPSLRVLAAIDQRQPRLGGVDGLLLGGGVFISISGVGGRLCGRHALGTRIRRENRLQQQRNRGAFRRNVLLELLIRSVFDGPGAKHRQIEHSGGGAENADHIASASVGDVRLLARCFIGHHDAAGEHPVGVECFLCLDVANPLLRGTRLKLALGILPTNFDGDLGAGWRRELWLELGGMARLGAG